MRKTLYILTIFLLTINVQAQNEKSEFIGTYGDMILANGELGGTELELKADWDNNKLLFSSKLVFD
ncbi:hypothetical protein RXV94_01830 [Yeosuana sp. MJ-SS3]|uniref:Uncharacterized protein n=1 Tax=Gilvirhabdus luticola TaxID=3079858 RepID=A0ABU3U398_9FLAO|nr:hypothetical protein [Yeosuana sp. MJ-SS3]MDU8884881.1 hypothetical protein [Yeosuana sp. MJ-SS3]